MKQNRCLKVTVFQTQLETMPHESSGWNPAISGAETSVYLKSGTDTDAHINEVR